MNNEKGADLRMQTANSVAEMSGVNAKTEPLNLTKRIGSTTFLVGIHFSEGGKETLEDKLLRLILSETGQAINLTGSEDREVSNIA
jgi:hypothetical protein